jgi:drug/metabolite transporter (DMT)-like permease
MTWQIAIALSVFLSSLAAIIQRRILKGDGTDALSFAVLFQFLCGVVVGIMGFILSTPKVPENIAYLIPNLIVMVILYSLGNVFIFKSLKETEASKFVIIFASRAILTILASALFLHEFLIPTQWLGVVFIFVSIILVNLSRNKFVPGRGELYAFLAALCFGLESTNDRIILKSFELYTYVSLAFIIPSLSLLLVKPKIVQAISQIKLPVITKKIIPVSIVYSLGAVTYFIALKGAPSTSQVAVINLTTIIITVVLSILILKEKDHLFKKLIAACLSFLGAYLIG